MAMSLMGMAAKAAFNATADIMGPAADGRPVYIWWPASWPLTNKRSIQDTVSRPPIRAVRGPKKATGQPAVGAAELHDHTVTFAVLASDIPAAVPAKRTLHFKAGVDESTAQIYRILVVNEVAGILELETTED